MDPMRLPRPVSSVTAPCCRAMPKSSTFTAPDRVIITFAGLMSRCTTPASWAAASAAQICAAHSRASGSGGSPRRSTADRVSPSTSSMTRKNARSPPRSVAPKSCTVAMRGWCRPPLSLASRASRSSSPAKRGTQIFTATARWTHGSYARQTVPNAPVPSRSRSR
nr:hypothetical protein [Streptomyces pactum]